MYEADEKFSVPCEMEELVLKGLTWKGWRWRPENGRVEMVAMKWIHLLVMISASVCE